MKRTKNMNRVKRKQLFVVNESKHAEGSQLEYVCKEQSPGARDQARNVYGLPKPPRKRDQRNVHKVGGSKVVLP